MKITKGVKSLVAEAEEQVTTLTPTEVDEKLGQVGLTLVDLRDIRELKREGTIPGALHVPRGMLEFWIDPESEYYRKEFEETMGMTNVSHMQGGMTQWVVDIGRVEPLPERK